MQATGSRTWSIALGGVLVIGIIGLMLAFLPPFNLMQRLQGGSYTSLTAENPVAYHQDGIQVVAAPDELDGSFGVKFDSVPQLNFLEGSAGDELRRAVESLPTNLVVKSPYYEIATKGQAPDSTIVAVDIPNNAEPWETLDLYTWTGAGWQWVGGRVDTNRELILANVGPEVPASVVVVQAGPISPAISTELPPDQDPSAAANSGITHLLPNGLLLDEAGSITGDLTLLPVPTVGSSPAILPSLRNWSEETNAGIRRVASLNQALLADVLANPGTRQAHINNIVALVVGQGYAGVDLDYRGVSAEWRDNYSAFVADLAQILHAQGKVLSLAVEAPSLTADGGRDTGGYDWRALGQAADVIRVPFPAGASSYGGDVQGYLAWALSQVSRYKLSPMLSTFSRDRAGDQVIFIGWEQALTPLGDVTGPDGTVVSPGETVKVDLGGEALNTLQQDQENRTYTYTYHDDQGIEHQVTIVTTASVAKVLELAVRYHLGGVFVAGLLEPGNDLTLAEVVRQFANQTPPAASDALQVVWTVETETGGQLAREDRPLDGNKSFEWTAPDTAGEYLISAAITFQTGGQSGGQRSIKISVATSEPVVTSTLAAETTPAPETETGEIAVASVSADCLNAAYVADVTVPDNTRFDKGEAFVKTWRVRNSGSCAWPEDAKLTFVDGNALGGAASVNVGALDLGGTTDIAVDMAAPDADGSYQGVWRLADGAGSLFGTKLTVVIKVGAEQANPAPVTTAPVGGGGGFELGGHIRTWNYAAQMKYAGMSWAKVQIHYGQDAVGLVQTAHNLGFKIQLSALGSPGMVTQPSFHADFSAWVASLAGAGADAIEVWNEPNIDREWQVGQISAAAYTQLLCASYNAIKAANASTAVISAAPAPTGYFGGCSANGCDDQPWLEGLYSAGAANCMDYIGAHHNSGATSPSARSGHPADPASTHHSWFFLPQTELYYNIFRGTRKLFYTEMGYASQEGVATFTDCSDWPGSCASFAWARGTDNSEQAAWLAEAVRLSRSTGMVKSIIVWNIDFPRYGYDPQDGYAIIRPGGGCPACDTLHAALQ
jgi:hypothetical protein